MEKKAIKSEISTVMFVDIVRYTETTSRLKRQDFDRLHDIFDSLSLPVFKNFSGKVIKKIGDAFLVTFKSATEAVLCGRELQKAFQDYSKSERNLPLKIRVAIHSGEVLVRRGDVYGEAVNTAARIEGIAGEGEVFFSEAVFSAMNKEEVPFVYLGLRRLKGLRYPIKLFRVRTEKDERNRRRKARRNFFRGLIKFVLGLMLLGGAIIVLFFLLKHFLNRV